MDYMSIIQILVESPGPKQEVTFEKDKLKFADVLLSYGTLKII